jgi:hypothetical protein
MSALALHRSLFDVALFSPFIIMFIAMMAARWIKRGRWLVHTLAVAAMVASMPIYLHIEGVLDPSSIEYPGPGVGFGILLWLFCLVTALILYAAYALFYATYALLARRQRRHQLGSIA